MISSAMRWKSYFVKQITHSHLIIDLIFYISREREREEKRMSWILMCLLFNCFAVYDAIIDLKVQPFWFLFEQIFFSLSFKILDTFYWDNCVYVFIELHLNNTKRQLVDVEKVVKTLMRLIDILWHRTINDKNR